MVLGCSEEIWCAIDGEKCVLKRILVPAMRSRRSPGARVSTTRHSAHSLGNERLMQPKTEKHSKSTNECGSSKASNTDMTTCNMRHDGVLGFFRRVLKDRSVARTSLDLLSMCQRNLKTRAS